MDEDPTVPEPSLQKTKVCSKCHTPKPLAEFHRNPRNRDGRENKCKVCDNEERRQRYASMSPEQKQRFSARSRAWEKSPNGRAYQQRVLKAKREQTAEAHALGDIRQRPRTHKYGAPVKQLPEYKAWASMRKRCYIPSAGGYAHYGGRGIKVCDRWRESFENFLADMGPKPASKYGLGRLNPNEDYTPENCRWMTKSEQLGKRRPPSNSASTNSARYSADEH